ncbi:MULTISPECIES: N-6 DNA methylase [Sphingomonadaceae]|uniref:SAM-dependent DNA methyltransferase n=1 Tax=Rhizorhabdus wittichii TaxID=160791 RepID=A0A975HGR1_9SPHN|nr:MULTISPECIES: N-6 DNA methylase [Sphingomonadaceae]QTH24718.1 SAM-dependent DNA methyltransferase [Rhizorhabdus wittichii]QUM74532.1 SAM-dependent DNA methyltransferase [Sphingopyxis granuli]
MGSADRHIKAICKLFDTCQYRHDRYTLFSDFVEAAAISLSNSLDLAQNQAREARYMEIVGRYDRDVIDTFPRIFAEVTLAMEARTCDVLGRVFGELGLANAARGQFFTPYSVCRMMAAMTADSCPEDIIAKKGFLTLCEPACGAGAMVIATCETLREAGVNYQRHLHVTAIDIDPRAVHMAYIQFALLHVPAIVIIGDSLAGTTRELWYTPAHILGGWNAKLAARARWQAADAPADAEAPTPAEDQPPFQPPPDSFAIPHVPIQLSLFPSPSASSQP